MSVAVVSLGAHLLLILTAAIVAATIRRWWMAGLIVVCGTAGGALGFFVVWASLTAGASQSAAGALYAGCLFIGDSPISTVVGIAIGASVGRALDERRIRYRNEYPICPECGYSMRGLTRLGCPECGWKRAMEPAESTARSHRQDGNPQ